MQHLADVTGLLLLFCNDVRITKVESYWCEAKYFFTSPNSLQITVCSQSDMVSDINHFAEP